MPLGGGHKDATGRDIKPVAEVRWSSGMTAMIRLPADVPVHLVILAVENIGDRQDEVMKDKGVHVLPFHVDGSRFRPRRRQAQDFHGARIGIDEPALLYADGDIIGDFLPDGALRFAGRENFDHKLRRNGEWCG